MHFTKISEKTLAEAKNKLREKLRQGNKDDRGYFRLKQTEEDQLMMQGGLKIKEGGSEKLYERNIVRPESMGGGNTQAYLKENGYDYNITNMTSRHFAALAPTTLKEAENYFDNVVFHPKDSSLGFDTLIIVGPSREQTKDKATGWLFYEDQLTKKLYVKLPNGNFVEDTKLLGKISTDDDNITKVISEKNIKVFKPEDLPNVQPKWREYWFDYWSKDGQQIGKYNVTVKQKNEVSDHITKYIVNIQPNNKDIVAYHFPTWPDYGTLDLTENDTKAIFEIYQLNNKFTRNKTTTHCKAGLGRTNVLLFAAHLLDHFNEVFSADNSDTLLKNIETELTGFRQKRPGAVQTDMQLFLAMDLAINLSKILVHKSEKSKADKNEVRNKILFNDQFLPVINRLVNHCNYISNSNSITDISTKYVALYQQHKQIKCGYDQLAEKVNKSNFFKSYNDKMEIFLLHNDTNNLQMQLLNLFITLADHLKEKVVSAESKHEIEALKKDVINSFNHPISPMVDSEQTIEILSGKVSKMIEISVSSNANEKKTSEEQYPAVNF